MRSIDAVRKLAAIVFSMTLISVCAVIGPAHSSETSWASGRASSRLTQASSGRTNRLVGHWRNTRIGFSGPRDEHLVLGDKGAAARWTVTASHRSGVTKGRWAVQANVLTVNWDDGGQWSAPFTFYEGNLVLPNVPNQRQFWELVE